MLKQDRSRNRSNTQKTPWEVRKGPLPEEEFKEHLLQIMDRKNHWAWEHFSGNRITKSQLKIHFQQEYGVYVRDFPIFLSRIHAMNPPMDVRRDLASNLYEEETGGLSTGRPHPELFLVMMEGLGYDPSDFTRIKLLPAGRRYRQWLDRMTTGPSWIQAAGVITIFVEGSIKERKESDPAWRPESVDLEEKVCQHPLVRYHGLDPACLDLVRAHHQIEGSHRRAAWNMILHNATHAKLQRDIYHALLKSLQLWLTYRDGVARACGLKR
jgi:pyrroloquinoline-quinone synthase